MFTHRHHMTGDPHLLRSALSLEIARPRAAVVRP
jgi:hypothetical protein